MTTATIDNGWLTAVLDDAHPFDRIARARLATEPVAALGEGAVSILRHLYGKAHGRRFSARYQKACAAFDARLAGGR